MNLWRHYKGDIYEVITFDAKNENGEKTIVYKPCYSDPQAPLFTQPYTRWFDSVDYKGNILPRFSQVSLTDLFEMLDEQRKRNQ